MSPPNTTSQFTESEASFLKEFAASTPTAVQLPGGSYVAKDFRALGDLASGAPAVSPIAATPTAAPAVQPVALSQTPASDPGIIPVSPAPAVEPVPASPVNESLTEDLNTDQLLTKLSTQLRVDRSELIQALKSDHLLADKAMSSTDILGPWIQSTKSGVTKLSAVFSFSKFESMNALMEQSLYCFRCKSHYPSKFSLTFDTAASTWNLEVEIYTLKTNSLSRKDILVANQLNYNYQSIVVREEEKASRSDSYYDMYSQTSKDEAETTASKSFLDDEEVQKFSMVLNEQGLPYQTYSVVTDDQEKKLMLKVPVAKLGEWPHPLYKVVKFEQSDFDEMKKNHLDNVLGFEPPLFLGHPTDYITSGGAPAEAFLDELTQEGEVLFGTYSVVEEQTYADVQKGKFRYASAEVFRKHVSKKTGEAVGTVLFGHALTNRPFVPDLPRVQALSDTAETQEPLHLFIPICLSQDTPMPTNANSNPAVTSTEEKLSVPSTEGTTPTVTQTTTPAPAPAPAPEAVSAPVTQALSNTQVSTGTGLETGVEERLTATIAALEQSFEQRLAAVSADAEAAKAELRQIKVAEKLSLIDSLPLPAETKEEYSAAIKDGSFGPAEEKVLNSLVKLSQTFSASLTTQQGVETSNEQESLSQENPFERTIERNKATAAASKATA